jgi:hypothetical protein
LGEAGSVSSQPFPRCNAACQYNGWQTSLSTWFYHKAKRDSMRSMGSSSNVGGVGGG